MMAVIKPSIRIVEVPVYLIRVMNIYHLDQAKTSAKKQHEMYIMEGFMDVIAAYRAGIENAVASMGTALTPEHVQHLSHFTKKGSF